MAEAENARGNPLARGVAAGVRRARALARRLTRRPSPSQRVRPELSVVVAAVGEGASLPPSLDSLAAQSLRRLEVIVVGEGPLDGARAAAERDDRFTVVEQSGLSFGAARSTGARMARGDFLAFLDAGETVPKAGYATLVGSLRQSGSDFVAGAIQLSGGDKLLSGGDPLYGPRDHRFVTLDDVPAALADAALTNRVFRADFWTGSGAMLVGDEAAEAVFSAAASTVRAARFDLVRTVAVQRRQRPAVLRAQGRIEAKGVAGSAVGGEAPDLTELDLRLHWWELTWAMVRAEAPPAAAAAWLGRLFDGELGDLVAASQGAEASYRNRLQASARRLLDCAVDAAWSHVRVERKVALWLAARGAWTELELLLDHFRLFGSIPATVTRNGRLYAAADRLPGLGDTLSETAVPEAFLELGEGETRLSGCLQRARWEGNWLEIDGWALVPGLDLHGAVPELTAEIVESASGLRHAVAVTRGDRRAANRWSRQRYADAAPGGFRISIDTALIDPALIDAAPGRWQLQVTLDALGVRRTGAVRAAAPYGCGRQPPTRQLQVDEVHRVVPQFDAELGFVVQVRAERVRAIDLALAPDGVPGLTSGLSGCLTVLDPALTITSVQAWASGQGSADQATVVAELDLADPAAPAFLLLMPLNAAAPRQWELRVIDEQGRSHRVSWPPDVVADPRLGGGPDAAGWVKSPRGYCGLTTNVVTVEARTTTVSEASLQVEVTGPGIGGVDLDRVQLVGGSVAVGASACRQLGAEAGADGDPATGEGRALLAFPLVASRWGGPELPLPSGEYRLQLPDDLGVIGCSAELLARLPREQLTLGHATTLGRGQGDAALVLRLEAPLHEDERGRYAQQQLAEWYAGTTVEPSDSVLFQSYRGEFATDSQLAIHNGLRRQGRALELLWGVLDKSVPIPEGGQGLLIESRAWYAALASSRYLCRNIDVERYFVKREHQRYLQTFHGYPNKSMGASLWRAQGRSETVVAKERIRRSSAWDAIVVPEEFCTDFYRREYGFEGRSLVTGYPRNDTLVTADAAPVRARLLDLLGIEEHRTVVLYAPTWRDTVATSAWTAALFDGLDLAELAESLGEGFAVLLRGHNYNLRQGLARPPAGVWDVSSYPEVNDLILAADVAVLDYSSLRFDWLITEKPMLFFVPDLEEYLTSRTVLFDYLPTAPGPILRSTSEVAAALLEPVGVAAEYAAARTKCNEQFNRLHDGKATERVIDAFF